MNLTTHDQAYTLVTDPKDGGVCDGERIRLHTPTEYARLQGFPDDWGAGQRDRVRYRQFGNAVTVSVAEWIGRRILESTA